MGTDNILEFGGREAISDPLTELIRKSAKQMIAAAVEEEVAVYLEELEEYASRRNSCGHAGVVRDGYHPERSLQTGIGPVSVRIPKVRSKDGKPVTFRSALVPPYVRKTKSLEAAVPWLYLTRLKAFPAEKWKQPCRFLLVLKPGDFQQARYHE